MTRVGWVYDKTKAELVALAKRYHIDDTGNIDTLRARIVAHVRANNLMEDEISTGTAPPPPLSRIDPNTSTVATMEDDAGPKDSPLANFPRTYGENDGSKR